MRSLFPQEVLLPEGEEFAIDVTCGYARYVTQPKSKHAPEDFRRKSWLKRKLATYT